MRAGVLNGRCDESGDDVLVDEIFMGLVGWGMIRYNKVWEGRETED